MLKTLVVAFVGLMLTPQTRPDFGGRWTSDPRPDLGSGWGSTITLTQDPRQLTVEYAFFTRGDMQPPTKLTYALDGSESRNTVMMGRGMQEERSKSGWDGQTLVITTAYAFKDPATGKPQSLEVVRKLSLESPDSLVVETTRGGALGGPPSTTRVVYRRATAPPR